MELPVAPGRAGAAQSEQRAAQLPHPVWRDEPERLSPRPAGDVVAVGGAPTAHRAPGLRRLVCRVVRVPRPEVGLAVQLGALLRPSPQQARVEDHESLLSHAARATSSLRASGTARTPPCPRSCPAGPRPWPGRCPGARTPTFAPARPVPPRASGRPERRGLDLRGGGLAAAAGLGVELALAAVPLPGLRLPVRDRHAVRLAPALRRVEVEERLRVAVEAVDPEVRGDLLGGRRLEALGRGARVRTALHWNGTAWYGLVWIGI